MKYIDAEKMRAEIEKRKEKHWDYLPDADSPEDDWTHNELCELGAYKELEHIESFLDSLQQEQSEKGLDVTEFCKPIDPGIAQCVADHWWEMLDGKESDKSLEEAAEEYFYRNWSDGSLDIKPQVKEDFKAGAEWQKKQMMKEAVEGEVIKTDKHTSVRYKAFYGTDRYFYGIADKQFKPGDKVRIIIIKEGEK